MDSKEAIHYFEKLNRLRIERVADLLSAQQNNVLSLIAFLFHTNIDGLPGYTDKNTPAGIIDFQPSKSCLNLAQKLFPGMRHKQRPLRHYPITGLYLVNHHGLLHIPEQANFSLYLVCAARLKQEQRDELEQKLSAIKEWAASHGIIFTVRLLVDDALISSQGETLLSGEQLDQFYLNGLIMAGALPYWWLVAPNENYANTIELLKSQRIQTSYQFVDFGEPQQVEVDNLLNQASESLASKLEFGLDGLFELTYLQQQLSAYPNNRWLSTEFKQRTYSKEYEPLFLDGKVLQLESLLASDLPEESKHLAQQSFYLQTKEALSKRAPNPPHPWRRKFVTDLCQNWQWKPFDFQLLDQRNQANYQYCLDEHQQTQSRLLDIHTAIKHFAKQQGIALAPINKHVELRLKQLSDTPEDTIPVLPMGLLAKSPEEQIHLYRFSADKKWKLSTIPLSDDQQIPLYQHASLINVLAWAAANHVVNKATRLMLADKTNTVTITQVNSLVQYIQKTGIAQTKTPDLQSPASLEQVFLVANFDQQLADQTKPNSVQLSSLHNDPFNYANRGETLVLAMDALIESSQGQWQTSRFNGPLSPLQLLRQLMPWWRATKNTTRSLCWCPSETHGPLISQRIETLYQQVSEHFDKFNSADYIIKIADHYYQLLWEPGISDLIKLSISTHVLAYLAKPRLNYYITKLDKALDPSGVINQVLNFQSADHISLVLVVTRQSASIYVLDNQNSLFSQHNIKLTETTLLNHYYRFLSTVKPDHVTVRCISLSLNDKKVWTSKQIKLEQGSTTKQNYLPVTVNMASSSDNATCTITCGPKQFFGMSNDPKLFSQVSTFLLSLRSAASKYPLYITGIQFQDDDAVTTNDYIHQKQRLEKLLNAD